MKQIINRRITTFLWAWCIGGALFLAAYIYVYLVGPFPGLGNDLYSNLSGLLAAAICAVTATSLWRQHDPGNEPRSTWRYFALGLWAWFAGDAVWMVYNLILVDVPVLSWADPFYLTGICLLAAALHRQYRGLYRPSARRDAILTSILVAAALLGALLLLAIANSSSRFTLSGYLNFFYASSEFVIALIAILYSVNFGRGALARPWAGLAVFALADALFAWLVESGSYAFSLTSGNLLSLISDSAYTAAYLVLALGLILHALLVKYGPRPVKAA